MSDEEVDVLLQNTDSSKLENRDAQEVVGYFQVLDLVAGSGIGVESSKLYP